MFNQKKSAAIAWLVGGISMTCIGIGHAVTADAAPQCTTDAQGNEVCVTKSQSSYTSPDGRYHVSQSQDCTTVERPAAQTPQVSLGQPGTTRIGPVVSCSNNAPAPQGFEAPDISR